MMIDILIFLGVFLAYFFATLSGGVGLVVRPLLIFGGLDPQLAVGSSKVANLVSKGVSLQALTAYRKIDWRRSISLVIPAFIGGWVGAEIVMLIEGELLKNVIGTMVIVMALFLFIKPHLGIEDMRLEVSRGRKAVGYVMYGLANALSTLTGAGGAVISSVLVVFFGETYISSAMIRKVAGYASTISGSAVFIINGSVSWYYVLIIAAAGSLGGYLGVKVGIKVGDKWIRVLLLTLVVGVGLILIIT